MRRIPIKKWKVPVASGNVPKEESLLDVVTLVINNNLDKFPTGLVYFQLFSRIGKAMRTAVTTNTLELQEDEYTFLKTLLEKYIPAHFGANLDIQDTIESFITAPEEPSSLQEVK